MTPNKYKPHLLVLPEDDANRQIANGFILNPALSERAIQILPPANGWKKAVDDFVAIHIHEMRKYPERRMLLLIDFDGKAAERMAYVKQRTPPAIRERTFVVGAAFDPENLRTAMGLRFEEIGGALARDCEDETLTSWTHALLKHNEKELDRMIASVRPFLFEETAAP